MIELRLLRRADGTLMVIKTIHQYRAVLQWREYIIASQGGGYATTYKWSKWRDVPVEDEK